MQNGSQISLPHLLKPVRKKQTEPNVLWEAREFPILYWGNGTLQSLEIQVSKLGLGCWSFEESKGWRCWGKRWEPRHFYIWITNIFTTSPSPFSCFSSLKSWFLFSSYLEGRYDDNSDSIHGSHFQSLPDVGVWRLAFWETTYFPPRNQRWPWFITGSPQLPL